MSPVRTLTAFALALASMGFIAALAWGAEPVTAHIVACYDGDTCTLDREILPGRDRLRVADIDAPELRWRAECLAERMLAKRAREYIQQFVGTTVTLTDIARDKYATRVTALAALPDGRDLGHVMVAAGLAVPWTGRQADWCAP